MDMSEFLKSLTPEQRVKAQKCTSAEEMLALAKEEKVALPDDVLAAVAGGAEQAANCSSGVYCKNCGTEMVQEAICHGVNKYTCGKCGYSFEKSFAD